MLLPIGLACAVVGGLGCRTAILGRSLPFFSRSRRAHGILLALVAIVVWAVAYQVVPKTLEEKQQEEREAQDEAARKALIAVQVACEFYIKARLKVPSTARFADFPAIVRNDDGSYVVKGEVDAQNAFGVMLRKPYICSVGPGGTVREGGLVE
jgi:hypothetical protein